MRSQTFFTHQDLRTQQNQGMQQSQLQRPNRDMKDEYCCDWIYTSKCDCHATSSSYSGNHRCRVCDMTDHPILHCPKRKFAIPSTPTNPDSIRLRSIAKAVLHMGTVCGIICRYNWLADYTIIMLVHKIM